MTNTRGGVHRPLFLTVSGCWVCTPYEIGFENRRRLVLQTRGYVGTNVRTEVPLLGWEVV